MEMKILQPILGILVALTKNEVKKICDEPDISHCTRLKPSTTTLNFDCCAMFWNSVAQASRQTGLHKYVRVQRNSWLKNDYRAV